MSKVSIVTASFNRAEQARAGIMSILKQNELPKELEIVFVDDGSTDNTADIANQLKATASWFNIEFKYVYLPHPEHRISSIPRNVGFKQSTGDIVIFTESEVLHVGNTIAHLLSKLEQHPYNTPVATQVWTMGERIWKDLKPNDFANPQRIIEHEYAYLTTDPNMGNHNAPDADWAVTGSNNCLTGCLFAVKRQWIEDIGGFDEDFEGHGFDDFDLFNRLAKYGKGTESWNDIVIIHQWHRKDYPYNIYEASDRNGKKSEDRIAKGEFIANTGKEWGVQD